MDASHDEPPHHCIAWHDYTDTGITVAVNCNATRFVIEVDTSDLEGSPSKQECERLLEQINRVSNDDDDDEDDWRVVDELHDLATIPCFALFKELAPEPPAGQKFSLHEIHFPTTHRLRLTVEDQKIVPRRIYAELPAKWLAETTATLHPGELPDLPRVRAREVTVTNNSDFHFCCVMNYSEVYAFTADGTKCHWRSANYPLCHKGMLGKYAQVARANLHHLRIPRLLGIVVSDDEARMMGAVFEWVTREFCITDDRARESKLYHARWKRQITTIAKELHRHGIVLGFMHPEDIWIDENMNVWISHLGGGWAEPYLPRELSDSVEGDFHWMNKMFRCLEGEEEWWKEGLRIHVMDLPRGEAPKKRLPHI